MKGAGISCAFLFLPDVMSDVFGGTCLIYVDVSALPIVAGASIVFAPRVLPRVPPRFERGFFICVLMRMRMWGISGHPFVRMLDLAVYRA